MLQVDKKYDKTENICNLTHSSFSTRLPGVSRQSQVTFEALQLWKS